MMKKLAITVLIIQVIISGTIGQVADTTMFELQKEIEHMKGSKQPNDTTDGISSSDEIRAIEKFTEEMKDTTRIRVGRKGIDIIESNKGETSVRIVEIEEEWTKDKKKKKKFEGNWSGIELGLNNFVDANYSMSRDAESQFMELHTGRSWNFNLNILEYGVGLGTNQVGLLTGLGFEFSNYFFDNNNSITKNREIGQIISKDYTDLGINLIKSKLSTTYLTVPLLLEMQFPNVNKSDRFYISGGVLGSLKIGSSTKAVYRDGGRRQKDKVKDDFYLNSLRYGLTARFGYKSLNVYANYYATSLFETDKGPELYPFAVGLALRF